MSDEFLTDTSATSEVLPDFEDAPEFPPQATDDRDEPAAEEPAATTDREADRTQQVLNSSQAGIVGLMSGAHSVGHFTHISYNQAVNEKRPSLNDLIAISNLHPTERNYKTLEQSSIVAYSGVLLQERILLLSCHHEDVALNVAKQLAYETGIANKELVIIDNSQGSYNFRQLMDFLIQPAGKRKSSAVSPTSPAAVCVWPAHDLGDDEISAAILASLLSSNAWIEHYKSRMVQGGVCLICVMSPQRIHDYKQARSAGRAGLKDWKIDFLGPLLEEYELSDYESLLETIVQQRRAGKWDSSDAEFYREITRCLTTDTLPHVVANKPSRGQHNATDIVKVFDHKDVVVATVLYCATYFSDLSHQDFTYLVDLFLGDTTEEVVSTLNRPQSPNGNEIVNIVEQVPVLRRWKRETDTILARCKIVPIKNASNRRVMDFSVDGLRSLLHEHISTSYISFYESNFVLLRQKGLLFSTRKGIAESARELFAEIASQYSPTDVANWLYEVIVEFDESIEHDRVSERSPLYRMLPDPNLKAARRHVCYGMSKLLNRLDKDELREAARIFWQRLLHNRHQWLLELLRRMGDFAPQETLKWLKQLFDQGTEETRRQARAYLLGYLLHRDLAIYTTIKELVQWPKSTLGGQIARQVLLAYFTETNRQIAQQDYGRWPAIHPLFSFQDRREADESIELLTSWLCSAAFEVDADDGLLAIADIFAGWCFILSPTLQPQLTAGALDENKLDNNSVRELLLTGLARHLSRAQRHELAVVWDRLENDMLNVVAELDSFFDQLNAVTFNVEVQSHVTACRKLLSTRSLLRQLRKDFTNAAKVVA